MEPNYVSLILRQATILCDMLVSPALLIKCVGL